MKNAKLIKAILSSFLIICVLWAATPKVYIHNLLNHKHDVGVKTGETSVKESEATEDCDFEKYNTPVYFSIFKFISNLIPVKHKESAYINKPCDNYNAYFKKSGPPRAPPILA